jgi:hypothetical protein
MLKDSHVCPENSRCRFMAVLSVQPSDLMFGHPYHLGIPAQSLLTRVASIVEYKWRMFLHQRVLLCHLLNFLKEHL